MTLGEGQAMYVKDFRYKKTWMPGTVVDKTGPVSVRIQLDDGSVIRRHQDHVRVREREPAADTVASEVLEAAPVAISIPFATSELMPLHYPTPAVQTPLRFRGHHLSSNL